MENNRWLLNSGSEMMLSIPLLRGSDENGDPLPIRAVIDLASLHMPVGPVVALKDHDAGMPVGKWSDFRKDQTGLSACLTLAEPSTEHSLHYVTEIADLLAAGTPIQTSVGAEPSKNGRWEFVPQGKDVSVNGVTFTGGGEAPLYILRNGQLFESSLVIFGADDTTGRLVASRLAELGLQLKSHIARAKAAESELFAIRTRPKSVLEALKRLHLKGFAAGKLKRGSLIHDEALRQWPHLRGRAGA